jgi:hypothetical protein
VLNATIKSFCFFFQKEALSFCSFLKKRTKKLLPLWAGINPATPRPARLVGQAACDGTVLEGSILPVKNVIGNIDQGFSLVIVAVQTRLVCFFENEL